MKKILSSILLAAALLITCHLSLVTCHAQSDGYTFLCDSNGVGLPGFYLNWSNLVGNASTAQFPSNMVTTAVLNTASNSIVTNSAAQLSAFSNQISASVLPLTQGGNTVSGTTNNGIFAGASNNLSAPVVGSAIVAGRSNSLTSATGHAVILGGELNVVELAQRCAVVAGGQNYISTASNSVVIGGQNNSIKQAYFPFTTGAAVIGGRGNQIVDGINSVILGGISNEIGHVYGYNGLYDGPFSSSNSIAAGRLANPVHDVCFVWSDGTPGVYRSTTNNQVLFYARNGFGINTNVTGTNALRVAGNADFAGVSIGGTNVFTLFSTTAVSNGLSALWNYNLNIATNALQVQVTAGSNNLTAASNALAARIVTTSNALVAAALVISNQLVTSSNDLQLAVETVSNQIASVTSMKAFSCYVPATYSSIGIGFNTPLMPDGNYSVSLVPQDQATAEAPGQGLFWWVGAKTASGFTIYVSYATNAYNLNFECIVKQNTQ